MQVGYKVGECDYKDCHYRIEPITNADRIRAMRDKELAKMMTTPGGGFNCSKCREIGGGECYTNCEEQCLEWLQQQAEEDDYA